MAPSMILAVAVRKQRGSPVPSVATAEGPSRARRAGGVATSRCRAPASAVRRVVLRTRLVTGWAASGGTEWIVGLDDEGVRAQAENALAGELALTGVEFFDVTAGGVEGKVGHGADFFALFGQDAFV